MKASAKGTKSESEITRGSPPAPGTYHVVCDEKGAKERAIKKDGTDMGMSIVETEVLGGTLPGQAGKKIPLFLQFTEAGDPGEKHTRFLMACGLLKPDEERDIDFESEVPGCQLIVKVEEYLDKAGKKAISVADFGLAMWHVNNPEVRDVPKCQAALSLIGTGGAAAGATAGNATSGNGNGSQGATAGNATEGAATTAADDYSDV